MNIEDSIKRIIIEELKLEAESVNLLPDSDLRELGMNSITFIKIIVEIESKLNIEYPDEKLLITECGTLKIIVDVVEKCLAEEGGL